MKMDRKKAVIPSYDHMKSYYQSYENLGYVSRGLTGMPIVFVEYVSVSGANT